MLKTATSQSFRCVLKNEYKLLISEIAKYSIIQCADERLFSEVEAFLESIKTKRSELEREQSKLKCTCPKSYKESTYVASRIIEIQRTVERIEEIDNEFMDMMNWYDIPAELMNAILRIQRALEVSKVALFRFNS